jgi:RNA polymerase sigma factor (sigma-70 family)
MSHDSDLAALGERERIMISEVWPEFLRCVRALERSTPKHWTFARDQIYDVALDALIRAAKSFRPELAHPEAIDPWVSWWRIKVRFGWLESRRRFRDATNRRPRRWSILGIAAGAKSPIGLAIQRAITDDRHRPGSAFEDREYVECLLRRLHHHSRDLIRSVYLGGVTQAEIAAARGINQSHISRMMAEARAKLRALADADATANPD